MTFIVCCRNARKRRKCSKANWALNLQRILPGEQKRKLKYLDSTSSPSLDPSWKNRNKHCTLFLCVKEWTSLFYIETSLQVIKPCENTWSAQKAVCLIFLLQLIKGLFKWPQQLETQARNITTVLKRTAVSVYLVSM